MRADPAAASRGQSARSTARTNYNRLARWYDLLSGPAERRLAERGLAALGVRPGEAALEIGFGTGHGLLSLARSVGRQGKVCGIDISDRMTELARARVAAAGLAERVELVRGDAARLPWASSTFGVAFMSFVLELLDDDAMAAVLADCRRVLVPGGRLGVVALASRRGGSPVVRLYEWAHRRFPHVVDCRPIHLGQTVGRAGFSVTRLDEASVWGLPVDIAVARRPATRAG